MRYAEFVVPLVKAMQEQQAMIKELQAKLAPINKKTAASTNNQQEIIAAQQKDIELLKQQVDELKAAISLLAEKN